MVTRFLYQGGRTYGRTGGIYRVALLPKMFSFLEWIGVKEAGLGLWMSHESHGELDTLNFKIYFIPPPYKIGF